MQDPKYFDNYSLENIAEDVQQQKEDIAELDTKVDATIDTVTSIGDTVVRHDKEIGELESGLDKIEERVDDVEDDMVETKIKVEEIDNKVLSRILCTIAKTMIMNLTYKLQYCVELRKHKETHNYSFMTLS